MKGLHALLEKFAKLTPPNASLRSAVSKSIEESLGIIVPMSHVVIKNSVAYVDAPPMARSEIALHKSAILERVAEALQSRESVRDIR